jgi:hypothetical protein
MTAAVLSMAVKPPGSSVVDGELLRRSVSSCLAHTKGSFSSRDDQMICDGRTLPIVCAPKG